MKQTYTVESKMHPNLIYTGIILIVINLFFSFSGARSYDINHLTKENVIIESSFLIVGIFFSIRAFIIARQLSRSGIFWAIFTLFLTPIALIILGTRDIQIDFELRKIFNKYKTDYFLEKFKLEKDCQNGKIDEIMLQEKILRARDEYNELMNREIEQEMMRLDEKHRNIVVEKVAGNGRAVTIKGKCPACDTKITNDMDECPECGLNFNY